MGMEFYVYEDFSQELKEIWQAYYTEIGGTYNSAYEWCYAWFKHFGQGKTPFIITAWQDENIKLIAPFYRKENTLYAIGTYPDFMDEFEVLCQDQERLFDLVNFILYHRFELDIKFLCTENDFFNYLLRRFEQENIYNTKIWDYAIKPLIYKKQNIPAKRLRRKEKLARTEFNDELTCEFNIEKNEAYIEEFFDFHKQKWNTFKSLKNRDFFRDLYLNCDAVALSRVYLRNSNKSIAYDFGYIGSNKVFYGGLFGFDQDYSVLSPGYYLHYNTILKPEIFDLFKYVDQGRGSNEYKYAFTDKERVIVNVKAQLCWKRHKQLYKPLKALKKKLLGV